MLMDTTIYRLLALCARAEGNAAVYAQLSESAARLSDWSGVPAQAEAHGMAPLLYHHLRSANVNIPPPVKRELQALVLRHRQANAVRTRTLCDVLPAFDHAGIQALVIKGAALAHIVCAEPGLRPMSDVDLLVPQADLARAQKKLAQLGFHAPLPDSHVSHRHLAAAERTMQGVPVQIEIHHQLLSDYFDNARWYVRSRLGASSSSSATQIRGLTVPPRAFALAGLTAHTLGHADMLRHLCDHLASHVNVWDYARLIWAADIASLAERFAHEIDWDIVRRQSPGVLNTLSLLHWMTPQSDELVQVAGIRPGRAPDGIGAEFEGWPRLAPAERPARGFRRVLRDTLLPSEWWLRLRYQLGSARPLAWHRWVRHPLYIAGHLLRAVLEALGWPRFGELTRGA
jgi:hypothetical protein